MKSVSNRSKDLKGSSESLKTKWKRLMQNHIKLFNPSIDYEVYLQKFREEFKKKWSNTKPSPCTGLEGFKDLGTLGSGSFGQVKLVQNEITGTLFAAKTLSKHKIVVKRQVKNAFYEKRVLHSINFPNHTSLEFSRKDYDYIYLGMTLVRGGELFSYHRRVHRFSEKQACFYAAQVFLALEYLHFLNLLYRDLKPENICIDLNGYIKITDYGFTKYVPNRTLTLCGTPEYLAPEIIKMKPYGFSVDWWAFGILVFEFVSGHSPFEPYAKEPLVMYDKICDGKFKIPTKFSAHLKNLVYHLLQPDLSKRLGVCNQGNQDIKQHVWFVDTDWYGLLNQTIQPPYIPSKSDMVAPTIENKRPKKVSGTNQYEDVFKEF